MEAFQWLKDFGFSCHGNTEDLGEISSIAEVAVGEGTGLVSFASVRFLNQEFSKG